jgi:hypothetical protein
MRHPSSTKTHTTTRTTARRRGPAGRTDQRRHTASPPPASAAPTMKPDKTLRPLAALSGGRATPPERAKVDTMTHDHRVTAMHQGQLSLRQLAYWSGRRGDEVPLIGGEFAYIAMYDAEYCESAQPVGETA